MNVLLIEDIVGEPIAKILQKWGHDVVLAPNGRTALQVAQQRAIDFFLVDWHLPDIAGLELIRSFRQRREYKYAPIVVISGRVGREDLPILYRSGADDFMPKPFTASQLRDKMAEVQGKCGDKTARIQAIDKIVSGHKIFDQQAANPLIVFGERFDEPKQLAALDQEPVVDYLVKAVDTIDAANRDNPYLDLGYRIATSTGEIVRLLKSWSTRDRVKLVAVSTACHGNHVLMSRLLQANGLDQAPVFLVYDYIEKIPAKDLDELESSGLILCQRGELDADQWQKMVERYANNALSAR